MTLTKEQILAANDLPREEVACPKWGGSVWVRTMSGTERDAYESEILALKQEGQAVNYDNFRSRFLVRTICDESGGRLFVDSDVQALGAKSAKELDRLYDVAAKLNRMREEDVAALAKSFTPPASASS